MTDSEEVQSDAATAACIVCEGTDLRHHFAVGGSAGADGLIPTTDSFGVALSDIVECAACGHMQLQRFPPRAELDAAYEVAESLDYVSEERGQRATASAVLAEIERFTAPGKLLDLGSWVGFLLSEAETRGWTATGIEPSEFASAYARNQLGLDVRTDDLFEVDLPDASFDAVFLGDVIEHLPRADQALGRIARLLTPGGVLAMTLPDAGSRIARLMGKRWWSVIPTHVHYFTRSSIARLLERRNFTPLSITTAPKSFTVSYYLSRIGGYAPALSRGLVSGAEKAGVAERLWAPDFRDRMLVVARRI